MSVFEWVQPTLFPPTADRAPELKIEFTVYLQHNDRPVEVWQRITVLSSGETVSIGNIYVEHGDLIPADVASVAAAVMIAALELHGPF